MSQPDESTLARLLPLLRQLREIKGLRESKPGTFQWKSAVFVQLQDSGEAVYAELKKKGGSGFDRYALGTPPQQRKLVDDAKRRVALADED